MLFIYICAMVKSRYIGDGHPTFTKNPYNGYINPYYWVDDHPLLYGNNGSLDPGKYHMDGSIFMISQTDLELPGICANAEFCCTALSTVLSCKMKHKIPVRQRQIGLNKHTHGKKHPKFDSLPLKNDGWKTEFLVGMVKFQGRTAKPPGCRDHMFAKKNSPFLSGCRW